MLLKVENLTIKFNNNTALENVSFELQQGETLGIVGESGSGKTLTGLAILGLLPQNAQVSGTIHLFQNNIATNILSLPESEKRNYRGKVVSMIFQEPMTALNPVVKCGKQVAEMVLLHQKISKKKAHELVIGLFNEVKLPNAEIAFNKYPHELSGGQRQRIMIAMAVACKPSLIIADEPTTALDVTIQKSVLDLLKDLQQKHNMGLLFVSHDLGVISHISQKVLVLNKGKQVEYGTIDKVMHHSENAYTQALWACRPTMNSIREPLLTVDNFLNKATSLKNKPTANINNNTTETLIEVANLNLGFVTKTNFWGKPISEFKALNNVNFHINKGETVGLVGESGSGKTTLGRAIMQLLQSQSGNICYKGQSVSNLSKAALKEYRQKVQLIFQDPYSSLNPWQTVGQSVIEPMQVHGIFSTHLQCKQKAIELFEATGLDQSFLSRYPHQLSGGQRQRVVIARALALMPEVIICDESVAALDVSVQAQVLNLLNHLKQQFGLSYIFISHDLAVVRYMSNRIYVMQQGNIVENGPADDICSTPKHEYTKHLINAVLQ